MGSKQGGADMKCRVSVINTQMTQQECLSQACFPGAHCPCPPQQLTRPPPPRHRQNNMFTHCAPRQ